MKLAVFRLERDWIVMGQVDDEGEAIMTGAPLPPQHPENRPHAYTADGRGPVLETGAICRCGRPRGHQIHVEPGDQEPDEDEADVVAGPIPVVVYDPVEIHKVIAQASTELGTPGFAIVRIPEVTRESFVTVHYDRARLDGLYELDAPGVDVVEPIVTEYLALRAGKAPTATVAEAEPRGGRRRIVTG